MLVSLIPELSGRVGQPADCEPWNACAVPSFFSLSWTLRVRALASLVKLDWEPLSNPIYPIEWKLPTDRNHLFLSLALSTSLSSHAHWLHN